MNEYCCELMEPTVRNGCPRKSKGKIVPWPNYLRYHSDILPVARSVRPNDDDLLVCLARYRNGDVLRDVEIVFSGLHRGDLRGRDPELDSLDAKYQGDACVVDVAQDAERFDKADIVCVLAYLLDDVFLAQV